METHEVSYYELQYLWRYSLLLVGNVDTRTSFFTLAYPEHRNLMDVYSLFQNLLSVVSGTLLQLILKAISYQPLINREPSFVYSRQNQDFPLEVAHFFCHGHRSCTRLPPCSQVHPPRPERRKLACDSQRTAQNHRLRLCTHRGTEC